MKSLAAGAIAVFGALFFFAATPAEARWAPGGSYESTCRHVDFDGDMLTASCQRRDGSWRNTWLDNADDCGGSIINNNGQLECVRGDWRDRYARHRSFDVGPRGSYRDTCDDIRMDGYTLRATCERRDGSWRWTALDYAFDCDGRIANFDGRLVCTRGRY